MNIFLSPSNIYWSLKDTRSMIKKIYVYYLFFASFFNQPLSIYVDIWKIFLDL